MIPVYKDSTGLMLCKTRRQYVQEIVLLSSRDIFIFLCPFLLLLSGEARPALIQIQMSSSHNFFLAKSHGKHNNHLSLSHSYDGLGRLEEMFLISIDLVIPTMNSLQRPEYHNHSISPPRHGTTLKTVTTC